MALARWFAISMAIALAGCGSGTEAACQTAPCGLSSQTYVVCTSGTQANYSFGGMSCTCSASQCTDCAAKVASYCGVGNFDAGVISPFLDGGVVTPGCTAGGGGCASFAQCCSQTCANGLCTSCGTTGAACATKSDCCAGPGLGFNCTAGHCVAACRADGQACVASTDCCGNVCASGLCKKTCQDPGQTCSLDSSCCSKICDSTLGKCNTCRSVGATCMLSSECCNGGTCTGGFCRATNATCAGPNSTCEPCCAKLHPAGSNVFYPIATTCNCDPAGCATECASDFCSSTMSTPVGSPCDTCLQGKGNAHCNQLFSQQCSPVPDCAALLTCLNSCT